MRCQVTNVKAFARQMAAVAEGSPQLRQQQQLQQQQQQQQHQWQQQQQQQQLHHAPLFPPNQPVASGSGLDAAAIAREREKMMLKQQVLCGVVMLEQ